MSDQIEAPQTLEGWYVLHDRYRIDWRRWAGEAFEQAAMIAELAAALQQVSTAGAGRGDSAAFAVVGQKADLLFVHYRSSLDELKQVELALRRLRISECLVPCGSYISIIEASLGEASAIAAKKVADQGIAQDSDRWREAFDRELAVQTQRLEPRLRPVIPAARYCCFYPMNKRRGEQANWYTLPAEERRALMRGHGRIGHAFHQQVTQVISGSIGLDDWEWAVTLFAQDPLVFKKLVYEMRFDPVSAVYGEFGSFLLGVRLQPGDLAGYFAGSMPAL